MTAPRLRCLGPGAPEHFQGLARSKRPLESTAKIPKAMRDAATLLRDHPPPDLPQEETEHLIDAIEAPYGARIVRAFRDALRASEDPRAQTEHVVAKAKELGLEPSPPRSPSRSSKWTTSIWFAG